MNLCFVVHHPGRRWDTVRCDELVKLAKAVALNFGLGVFPSRAHLYPHRLGRSAARL
jgi:hypothetical protein